MGSQGHGDHLADTSVRNVWLEIYAVFLASRVAGREDELIAPQRNIMLACNETCLLL